MTFWQNAGLKNNTNSETGKQLKLMSYVSHLICLSHHFSSKLSLQRFYTFTEVWLRVRSLHVLGAYTSFIHPAPDNRIKGDCRISIENSIDGNDLFIHLWTLCLYNYLSPSSKSAPREYWVEPDQLEDLSKLGTCQGDGKWVWGDRIQGEFVRVIAESPELGGNK